METLGFLCKIDTIIKLLGEINEKLGRMEDAICGNDLSNGND